MSTDITPGEHDYVKHRQRKVKKNQNLRTRNTNEDVEQVSSLRTFSQGSIEGSSTDVECITYLYSTGHVGSGTSIVEHVICQVNEGINLPSAMNRSYGTETQPEPSEVGSKIRKETHGLIVYNISEILEGTPAESRTQLSAVSLNESWHQNYATCAF